MLLSALTTEAIGIHALFGAFLLGAIVPHDGRIARAFTAKLKDPVTALLLPAFFAYTTRLLDKLAERKLIERNRLDTNRREVRVGITAAGLALLEELQGPLRGCHTRQLGHLTRTQLRDLTSLLRAARLPHEGAGSSWR